MASHGYINIIFQPDTCPSDRAMHQRTVGQGSGQRLVDQQQPPVLLTDWAGASVSKGTSASNPCRVCECGAASERPPPVLAEITEGRLTAPPGELQLALDGLNRAWLISSWPFTLPANWQIILLDHLGRGAASRHLTQIKSGRSR